MTPNEPGQLHESNPAFTPSERQLIESGEMTEAELRELIEYDSSADSEVAEGSHAIPEDGEIAEDKAAAEPERPAPGPHSADGPAGKADSAIPASPHGPNAEPPAAPVSTAAARHRTDSVQRHRSGVAPRPQPRNSRQGTMQDLDGPEVQKPSSGNELYSASIADTSGSETPSIDSVEPPLNSSQTNESRMQNNSRPAAGGENGNPSGSSRPSGVRRNSWVSIRRSLRWAAVLLLAAGFGAAGYFAGNPDAAAPGRTDRSLPAVSLQDNQYSDLPQTAFQNQDPGPFGSTDADLADTAVPALGAAEHEAPAERKLIAVELEFDRAGPETVPISADELNRWSEFFRLFETGNGKFSSSLGAGPVMMDPAPMTVRELRPENLISPAVTGADTLAEEPETQSPFAAHPLDQQTGAPQSLQAQTGSETGQESIGGLDEAFRTGRSVQSAAAGPIGTSRLLEMEMRIQSAENRILALEQEKSSQILEFSNGIHRSAARSWPLREGQLANGGRAAESQPQASRSRTFSLVSVNGRSGQQTLRSARVGDFIDGYGTVNDIIVYDDGGRMLMMDGGSVYVN